jgi:hypothetical protein
MMSCAPPVVAPPPVLRSNRETLAWLTSRWRKPPDLIACPAPNHPPVSFMAQPINCSLLGFEAQTKKPTRWFWCTNHQTRSNDFEAQIEKPSTLVLRLNQETRSWFWGSTKKPDLLISTCMVQTAHGITRPPDRPATEYPTCALPSPILCTRSPTMILIAAHHVAPAICTPQDKQTAILHTKQR